VNLTAQVLAVVAALVHVWAGTLESFFFARPGVHQRIFHTRSEDLPALRLWSFCQGFYNLFLAAGTITGVALLQTGSETAGRTLVVYTCAFMAGSGVVLAVANRRHLDGALGQALPPLGALIAAAI
jgi:putative membrane protein